mmetsp:Transcript_17599/g.68317  ORF Transcript_17599/g.68317 Transcript_17599/m.68317 type:complete len:240 (+) Transcript_17599:749-1468(+)
MRILAVAPTGPLTRSWGLRCHSPSPCSSFWRVSIPRWASSFLRANSRSSTTLMALKKVARASSLSSPTFTESLQAVRSSLFSTKRSAFASTSASIASRLPASSATCSGVLPALLRAFTSAPASRSSLIASALLLSAAACSGWLPSWSCLPTSAFAAISSSSDLESCAAATWAAVAPSWLAMVMSALRLSRVSTCSWRPSSAATCRAVLPLWSGLSRSGDCSSRMPQGLSLPLRRRVWRG